MGNTAGTRGGKGAQELKSTARRGLLEMLVGADGKEFCQKMTSESSSGTVGALCWSAG